MLLEIGYKGMSTNGEIIKYVIIIIGVDSYVVTKNHVLQVFKFENMGKCW